jgi:hypothetical protein
MTDTMTSRDIDFSSSDTLYIKLKPWKREGKNI